MTLSQTTLSQNGSNNPSSSKKCSALEEENNCLREKLTNEELKYSTAKEELKALRKHSEALEAELSASEDSSLFMKKKVIFLLVSYFIVVIRENSADALCCIQYTTKWVTLHRLDKRALYQSRCDKTQRYLSTICL